ncbi:hypothetical protein W02_24630 [Nitrospira sp. KM1]|uniref:hypothetical protein n=1 Tax=Nitrospira sp. KM1 TaxID=1936990 RepID=UPI0013A7343C|nr:hypothetical protein [Nitrospira sp. KM1]BCA55323.1 hypothetical protein W02_24630 [Nitrospira sp. KM1]
MDADSTPGWATGPDCFENEEQQRAAEDRRTRPIEELRQAYYYGELHLLAHAIRDFRRAYKMLFASELREFEEDLLHLIHLCEQKATYDACISVPEYAKKDRTH